MIYVQQSQLFRFSDISLEVSYGNGMLSLSALLSHDYRTITHGLLGNFDGDPSNDYILPDGTVLSGNISEQEVFDYGQACKCSYISSHSLSGKQTQV